mgnify:CR=1 FL=1|jgi:pyrroline-5-carboxylate reductase
MSTAPTRACVLLLFFSMSAPSAEARRFGFVGTGTMSSAIVRGLCTLPEPPASVVVSPRNAEKAAALAAEFPALVTIAKTNQAVLDASDTVFVGVLPAMTELVLRELTFDVRHTVVSLVSTAPFSLLYECCAPVPKASVVRAIPLPPVAKHKGATVMAPQHPAVEALFDSLGTVVAVETEDLMKRMMPVTCLMGQFYAQQRATQAWLESNGIPAAAAAKWTGAVFHCVSYDSAECGPETLRHLVEEQTPGGLNEQVVRELTEAGCYDALADSLDGCLARVTGAARAKRQRTAYSSKPE